jgi:hypothetical protein
MRSVLLGVVCAVAVWLGMQQTAAACSCVIPDLNRNYENADQVLRVRVVSPLTAADGERRYLAVSIGDSFKGCLPQRQWLVIKTRSDSAACGIRLQIGTDYLLYGSDAGQRFGVPTIETGLCSGTLPWADVPEEQLTFLNSRYVCCGEQCGCNEGEQVMCFVDPCEVSKCDVEGAVCNSNYCGGCNAEWTDPSGGRVCLPRDACDDPDRRYVAESPEQCALVRFTCVPGEAAFFDECGCGCATQHPVVTAPCRTGGCSGQLCLGPDDEDVITTCEFRPEYACYRGAVCETQGSGECGWTQTVELSACLEQTKQAPAPTSTTP